MSNEKTLKLLKEAFNLELWVVMLYEDYLDRIKDKRMRKMFIDEINESVKHAGIIRDIIHKLKLKMPVKRGINKDRVKKLLKTCLKEEIGAQKLYKKLISKIPDKEIKKKLKRIYNDEVKHEKDMRKLSNVI